MQLNFTLNSIIKFTLYGCGSPIVYVGKVIDITSTTITILPQLTVSGGNTWETVSKIGDTFINPSCTADSKQPIHLNRSQILAWSYARPTDVASSENLILYLNDPINKRLAPYTINQYDDKCLFIGDGPDCSCIEEKK